MSKGATTRHTILRAALGEASLAGLDALSIGGLARDVGMSKSGLFAHFGSKEDLQLAVIEHAADLFATRVVKPAVREPRGLPRLRALFANWVAWTDHPDIPGGCIFMGAAAAYDDRPGAVRDLLAAKVGELRQTLARACAIAVDEGHLDADVDPDQFAYELHGILLVHHIESRLFDAPHAHERSQRAFDALVARHH